MTRTLASLSVHHLKEARRSASHGAGHPPSHFPVRTQYYLRKWLKSSAIDSFDIIAFTSTFYCPSIKLEYVHVKQLSAGHGQLLNRYVHVLYTLGYIHVPIKNKVI